MNAKAYRIKTSMQNLIVACVCCLGLHTASAVNANWLGGAGNGFSLAGNWSDSYIPGQNDAAVFTTITNDQPTLTGYVYIKQLLFGDTSANTYTGNWNLGGAGQELRFNGGDGIDTKANYSGTINIDATVNIYRSSPTWTLDSGTLVINGPVIGDGLGQYTRYCSKQGNGTLVLSNTLNNISFFDLNKGTLIAAADGALTPNYLRISGYNVNLDPANHDRNYTAGLRYYSGSLIILGTNHVAFTGTASPNGIRADQSAELIIPNASCTVTVANGFQSRYMTTSVHDGETADSAKLFVKQNGTLVLQGVTDLQHSGPNALSGQIELQNSATLRLEGSLVDTLIYGKNIGTAFNGTGTVVFTDAMVGGATAPIHTIGRCDASNLSFDLSGLTAEFNQVFTLVNASTLTVPGNLQDLLSPNSEDRWTLSRNGQLVTAKYTPRLGTVVVVK